MGWGGGVPEDNMLIRAGPDLFVTSAVDAQLPSGAAALGAEVFQCCPASGPASRGDPFPVIPTQGPACWEALEWNVGGNYHGIYGPCLYSEL